MCSSSLFSLLSGSETLLFPCSSSTKILAFRRLALFFFLSACCSLFFLPSRFKCLLIGLLSRLGEVLDIAINSDSHFSPHVNACILWKLTNVILALLNIFYGNSFFSQFVIFDSLPPSCKYCLRLSGCSCLDVPFPFPPHDFQLVVNKKKSVRIPTLVPV
ncbi:hypothetical protein O6H91_Y355500 [Diphasiastrum complanatum]|nr:hypothetical protein O6H91_Y355500 [Diphasiastrum complanatum]